MKITCVLVPSTIRLFPNDAPPARGLASLDVALNERFSFQLALHADEAVRVRVALGGPEDWSLRVRRVGFVPVPHHNPPVLPDPLETDGLGRIPGFVPDPLFDECETLLPQEETNAFWFTVWPGPDASPGRHRLDAVVETLDGQGLPTGRARRLPLVVRVHTVRLAPRRGFHVTHWFYADCLMDRLGAAGFDATFWKILPAYFRDMAEHGQDTIYVPLFTPPLDGVKRPSQLLRVGRRRGGGWSFDWTDVRRYVRLARRCGLRTFEWCHLFTAGGCRNALRVYEGQGERETLLWPADTQATAPVYRRFLAQLLPELLKFLRTERIVGASLFHLSDEPSGPEGKANYAAARQMLREIAPWMRFLDAVSEIDYCRDGVVDTPVPTIDKVPDFHAAGIPSWCYYCCEPRGAFLQHFLDTPLAKIAMHGFLFWRWPLRGFLHWGLNYWNVAKTRTPVDPYAVSDGTWWPGWAYGDTFLVYPGAEGPVDSIRWEVFSEAMQDYALLESLGVPRDDPLLAPIRSFADFPKNADWRLAARRRLFARADALAASDSPNNGRVIDDIFE